MNNLVKPFPNRIDSERLYIRPILPGDGIMVHEAITRSREELKQWLPFAQKQQTAEQTEENIIRAYAAFLLREDIRLHIFRKEDEAFIGATGLHRINWEIPKFEIGYWIDTKYSGNGYITEAVEALTQFAINDLCAKRVEIRCDSDNINSRRIPERLGFTLEGILRQDSLSADGSTVRDTCVFAKTAR